MAEEEEEVKMVGGTDAEGGGWIGFNRRSEEAQKTPFKIHNWRLCLAT